MGRRVLFIVLLLMVGLFAYLGYHSYDARRAGLSGEVFSNDPSTGKTKEEAVPPGVTSSGGQTVVYPAPVMPETAQNGGQTTRDGAPESDTISPNPPNGMLFAGTGKYQLYRQGNLTWRLNTATGKSCILFATDKEWKKPKVYWAGCGSR